MGTDLVITRIDMGALGKSYMLALEIGSTCICTSNFYDILFVGSLHHAS